MLELGGIAIGESAEVVGADSRRGFPRYVTSRSFLIRSLCDIESPAPARH